MKKLFKRFYKRFKVKMARYLRNNMKTYEEVEPHEKTGFKICIKLISDKDSDFMIAPMSQKRFIVNEKLNIFIIIDYGRVEITNHIFHYDVKLSIRDYERLIYIYDTETEKRRVNTEKEVKSNIKNSLETVLERLTENINKK